MSARCQFPVSGVKTDGTEVLCGEPAVGYFDFSVANMRQLRYCCYRHRIQAAAFFDKEFRYAD